MSLTLYFNEYSIFFMYTVEWNAHENAVFDIAWMEGEQFLVRRKKQFTSSDFQFIDTLTLTV